MVEEKGEKTKKKKKRKGKNKIEDKFGLILRFFMLCST
jgi:hypothetical protein